MFNHNARLLEVNCKKPLPRISGLFNTDVTTGTVLSVQTYSCYLTVLVTSIIFQTHLESKLSYTFHNVNWHCIHTMLTWHPSIKVFSSHATERNSHTVAYDCLAQRPGSCEWNTSTGQSSTNESWWQFCIVVCRQSHKHLSSFTDNYPSVMFHAYWTWRTQVKQQPGCWLSWNNIHI